MFLLYNNLLETITDPKFILSNQFIIGLIISLVVIVAGMIFIPGIRSFVLMLLAYTVFGIGLTIRFYILLPIGLLRTVMYLLMGEIVDFLSEDKSHPISKIIRNYVPKLFLIQLQRYNGLGDQVPGFSVLAIRYLITIIAYMAFGILYLWVKTQYGFASISIDRVFIILAAGIITNFLSVSLYHIISALRVPPPEPGPPPEPKLSTSTLYKVNNQSDQKASHIMNIYRNSAPILAQMQRNDLSIKPFFIAYRSKDQDFFQYDDSFNVMDLIRVVNELPVIDENGGMIDYCIYYKNGKSFHKTEYMTRERLKILSKAVMTIYMR